MPARFCPQCGVAAVPGARFCIDCGAALAGGAPRAAADGGLRLTTAGGAVLGFFLVAGLGIWTAILQPEPPRPVPGSTRDAAAEAPMAPLAQGALPPDHPKVQVPSEVKTFIDDLAKKADADPKDVSTWSRLGQVYYRTAQIDPSYYDKAKSAFGHVLELDPKNVEALRGLGSVHFELDEPDDAIATYKRYLDVKPDDETVRTALGASYVSAGDLDKAVPLLRDVIAKKDDVWPAHYYLGVALGQKGDNAAALTSLRKARELATEDGVRSQIDDTIARFGGSPASAGSAPAVAAAAPRSPFQRAVEEAFRGHQIMGPRITGFEWSGPGMGKVLVQNFPMQAMPEQVRDKFTGHLSDALRDAAKANDPGGPVKMEIADAGSGAVMVTLTPSASAN
jgi:cytochrome c-type biogenesis protein CcmH/NrfG